MTRLRQAGEAVTGLLAPRAAAETSSSAHKDGRPQHDWGARPRDTILSALRYTQFVAFMKRALPMAAVALVVAVGAYFFFQRSPQRMQISIGSVGRIDNDLAMVKPRLSGTYDNGNPFVITADAAVQDRKNSRRVRLEKVEADTQINNARWLNASATRGLVDMDAGTLALWDGLSVFSDQGYELHTSKADVDLKAYTMTGPEVTGEGPLGSLRADKFRVDKNQLALTGNVHMTLVAK